MHKKDKPFRSAISGGCTPNCFRSHCATLSPPVAYIFSKTHQVLDLQFFTIIESYGSGKAPEDLVHNRLENQQIYIFRAIQHRLEIQFKAAIIAAETPWCVVIPIFGNVKGDLIQLMRSAIDEHHVLRCG